MTTPPYNNKQDCKGGTQDKSIDSHTTDSAVSRHDDAGVKRNLYEENKNSENDEYIDDPPIKNENIRKRIFLKRFQWK